MKVKEINLQIVHNLGNYESVRYGITVEVEEGERALFAPLKNRSKNNTPPYIRRGRAKNKNSRSTDGYKRLVKNETENCI